MLSSLVVSFALVVSSLVPVASWASETRTGHSRQGRTRSEISVVVLPIVVDGKVPASQLQRYGEVLRERLQSAHYRIAKIPADATSRACKRLRCGAKLARTTGSQLLLRTRLRVRDRSYYLNLELYEATTQMKLAASYEDCELCGLQEVNDMVRARAALIADKIESLSQQSANLSIESDPEGARVRVDGILVGTTPIQHFVAPGEHEVVVEMEGHVRETRAVEVVRGVREILEFRLDDAPEPVEVKPEARGPRDGPRRALISMQAWGFLSLGAAVLSAAAGTTYMLLHDRPYTRNCTGMYIDAYGTCRFKYDTMEPGIVFMSLGGALLVTSIGLISAGVVKSKRAREAATDGRRSAKSARVRFDGSRLRF